MTDRLIETRIRAEEAVRPSLLARYGEAGVAELALAVAPARGFPTVKPGPGYARSCSLVDVAVA